MTTEWVSAVASTGGTLVAAIGLFLIVRTLQHSQKQNKNSIYQLVTSRMASITETFLEYPERDCSGPRSRVVSG
jgi:predicted permease